MSSDYDTLCTTTAIMSLNAAHLSLYRATPAQTIESRRRSFPEWGKAMTLETYLERDAAVEKSAVGVGGKFTTWVLAPREDPETLDFLCACETFRREVVVARKSRADSDTTSEDWTDTEETSVGYGIASVFTPPANRGSGYAKHMMRLLHWVLASSDALPIATFPTKIWGAPPERPEEFGDAVVSVLYSDIGPTFHQQCGFLPDSEDSGWEVAPHASTIWNVDRLGQCAEAHDEDLRWDWLDGEELKNVWEEDSDMLKTELSGLPLTNDAPPKFTFLPRKGLAEFHNIRVQRFVEMQEPNPRFFGVRLQDEGRNGLSYASWTFDHPFTTSKRVVVTRLRCVETHFRQMLLAIAKYCREHGIDELEIWNVPAELMNTANETGGVTSDMPNHLPCVRWYGSIVGEKAEWVHNEK